MKIKFTRAGHRFSRAIARSTQNPKTLYHVDVKSGVVYRCFPNEVTTTGRFATTFVRDVLLHAFEGAELLLPILAVVPAARRDGTCPCGTHYGGIPPTSRIGDIFLCPTCHAFITV